MTQSYWASCPTSWCGYRYTRQCPIYTVIEIKPRDLHMLEIQTTNWATSLALLRGSENKTFSIVHCSYPLSLFYTSASRKSLRSMFKTMLLLTSSPFWSFHHLAYGARHTILHSLHTNGSKVPLSDASKTFYHADFHFKEEPPLKNQALFHGTELGL